MQFFARFDCKYIRSLADFHVHSNFNERVIRFVAILCLIHVLSRLNNWIILVVIRLYTTACVIRLEFRFRIVLATITHHWDTSRYDIQSLYRFNRKTMTTIIYFGAIFCILRVFYRFNSNLLF